MKMKLRLVLAVTALVLTLTTSADHKSRECSGCWEPVPAAPTVDQALGVNIHFTDAQPGEMKMIAEAGFRWIRMDFKWDLTEPERGRYDFSPYDRLLTSMDQYQLKPLFILDYGNPHYTEGMSVRTEEARQAFARWAVAAAKHFSGRGILWEMFNEPNVKLFWPPQPDVNEYAALALVVGRALRAQVPNERFIGPATSGVEFNFIESCFQANLLQYWQAVSVHPYRQRNPELAANEYAYLRRLISDYAARQKLTNAVPIISGEWGYSAVWRKMSEEKQATFVARMMLTNLANGIPVSIWYDWRDDGTDKAEPEHHFGLVRHEYRSGAAQVFEPKPAYLAVKTLTDQLRGFQFVERLGIGADYDYVLAFERNGQRRIVAWTTATNRHGVRITGLDGEVAITGFTGDSLGRRAPAQNAIEIELSGSPVYLVELK